MTEQKNLINTPSVTELQQEIAKLNAKVKAYSSLIEVGILISAVSRLDSLLAMVMEKARTVMNAEAASIFLINHEKQVFECPVAIGEAGETLKTIEIPLGSGIAGWVASHGTAEIIPDAYKDERFNPEVDLKTGFVTRSIMVAPLKVREKLIGVAEVINRRDGKPFESENLELFKAFCRQVAMAIETARLRKMEEEKQRLEQQLEAAKWIQKSFLPEGFPVTETSKIEIAATSLPAAAVGGDFYDYVILDNGKVGVSIGDVAGKGIPAALFMARLISDFRLFSQRIGSPGKLTTFLNRKVTERSRRGMFVTFLYGLLDSSTLTFRFSNAGHLPVVHIPANGGDIRLIKESGGVPLGILPNAEYAESTITLSKGDFLVLISDGIVEAKNSAGEAFQFDHLLKALSPSASSAQALMDNLIDAVQQFTSGAIQHDDSTVVVIRVN